MIPRGREQGEARGSGNKKVPGNKVGTGNKVGLLVNYNYIYVIIMPAAYLLLPIAY